MVKYREILRLHAQGVTQRGIASSCGHSRNTVRDVLKKAEEIGVVWPLRITGTVLVILYYNSSVN